MDCSHLPPCGYVRVRGYTNIVTGQVKATIPALRESKGRIILVSSGAAAGAYGSWGAYGSSKAALNHLALTLTVEEPDITSISIRPGVVDTAMQQDIRNEHSQRMDAKDANKFKSLYQDGGLLKPEQPGNVIARLALDATNDLSGKFLKYVLSLFTFMIRLSN